MERRLILAIALSLLVLVSWSTLVSKIYHIENKEVRTKIPPSISTSTPPEPEIPTPSLLKYSQDKFEIIFIEPAASIKEVTFKAYQDYKFPLSRGFLVGVKGLSFKQVSSSAKSITFLHIDPDKKITKEFIFSNYAIDLEITIQNLSNQTLKVSLPLVLGVLDFSHQNLQARYQDITVATKERTLHLNARKDMDFPEVKFLSLRERYFCSIIEPVEDKYKGFVKKINSQTSEVGIVSGEFVLAPGEQQEQKFHIYLGPQELREISSLNPNWSTVVHYGIFDFVGQILLQLLGFFFGLVHNWGGAIILLSLAIYLLLYPLTLKQMHSMKQMQALQPQIEELRKTYKNNPQKQNKEIMELYRQHKVNPFGGCLPLILQMPIFFALYQTLMRSVVLRGASFLWIKDLSAPDRLFILPISLPIIGNEINILPIVMTIGMFIQQKISAVTTSASSAAQQRFMLILFPLLFGLIFYHLPAGLVLYWCINSFLMLWYQFRITRKK